MSELRPFNTSVKDSTSVKLRNFNASKKVTRQLEIDSRKMEERLRELKVTMNREKEEREHQGKANIWASGKQSGSLSSHANEVLKKKIRKPQAKNKVMKVKILKDEPLDIPDRPSKAKISGDPGSGKKIKGPSCGQCEEKPVSLTCMECGENYCTTCFARFHLKGALKNHRSIPFQSNRTSLDGDLPRPETPKVSRGASAEPRSNSRVVVVRISSPAVTNESSVSTGGALLQGDYNESESAASFAAALAEWRNAKTENQADGTHTNTGQTEKSKVHEMGVGDATLDDRVTQQKVEIKFSDDSLTYADRLLLKRHRRTELKGYPVSLRSPRYQNGSPADYPGSDMGHARLVNGSVDSEDYDEETQEEHLRYTNLFNSSEREDDSHYEERPPSQVVILEMEGDPTSESHAVPEYHIQEASMLPSISKSPSLKTSSVQVIQLMTPEDYTFSNIPIDNHHQDALQNKQSVGNGVPNMKPNASADKLAAGVAKVAEKYMTRPSRSAGSNSYYNVSASVDGRPNTTTGITKTPSASLQEVTQGSNRLLPVMQVKSRYADGLGGFFMAGVVPNVEETSVVKNRPATTNVGASSLYKGPDVWRPSSSVATSSSKGMQPTPPKDKRPSSGSRRKGSERGQRSNLQDENGKGRESQISFIYSEHVKSGNLPLGDDGRSPQTIHTMHNSLSHSDRHSSPQPSTMKDQRKDLLQTKVEARVLSRRSGRKSQGAKGSPRDGKVAQQAEHPRSASRIEIEGDDFSAYDGDMGRENQDSADQETLEELAWELASQSGRASAADGHLSSLSLMEDSEEISVHPHKPSKFASSFDEELGITLDDGLGSGLSTPCEDFTVERLREEDLQGDFEEIETERDRRDVKDLDHYKER